MKRGFVLCIFCTLFLTSVVTFAQVGANYYLPLKLGNHISLYSGGNNTTGYQARTATYSIEATDSIAGQQYFREVGRETGSNFSDIFRVQWLRTDSLGDVVLGAIATKDGSTNIDSATLVGLNWLPNQFLTKGYSRTFNLFGTFVKDSVISVSESVSTPAGTFNNCLDIKETITDSAGTTTRLENDYHASGIGLVNEVVTIGSEAPYTFALTTFGSTGIENPTLNLTARTFSLSQNYPNPFNPTTIISYQVANLGKVSLKVFDLLGREKTTLVNEVKSSGSYEIIFNAVNLPSGIYFYRLEVGSYSATKKLVLLK